MRNGLFFILKIFIYISVLKGNLFSQNTLPQDNLSTNQVFAVCDKVIAENRIAGNFPADSSASLPIGISKTIAGTQYVIAIDSARFFPDKALCSAFMAIELPGSMDRIAFAAKNISINPKGVMSSGNSRLLLVSEHHIRISQAVILILKNDGSNYVEWDCNGFKSVNLKGYFEFSNSILLPDTTSTKDTKVTASFEIHTNDVHNIIIQVNITPFTLKDMRDIAFSVSDATVDLSELVNTPNMVFPEGYQPNGPDLKMWTGFYIKNFTVKLPKELSKKNQERTTISASNLIIDNSGVSGLFNATNLLPLESSDMGGWQFSVNQLSVIILQNHLNGGGMEGLLKIPVFENNALVYNAGLHENLSKKLDYQFIINPQSNLQATVFSSSIDLYPSSKIIVNKTNDRFYPKADLTGQFKLNANAANTGKLDFQNMIITSEAPYLSSGIFGFTTANSNENKIGKFPVTINKIEVVINQTVPNIYFQVGINFMKIEDKGFAAVSGFRIMTKFVPTNDNTPGLKWKFNKINVEDIGLDIQTQAFKLNGYVIFREDDPVYGNEFSGRVKLNLPSINLAADVNVIFGAKEDYKYFYVDGKAALPTPIIVSSGVAIYRFMGGLYYHMKQPTGNASNLYTSAFGSNLPPSYIPDPTISLGFKSGVTLGMTGKEDAFNADVSLEVQFTNSGGLSLIKFTGDCFLMTSIEDRKGKKYTEVPVGAFIYIGYDFLKPEFHAILNVGINYNGVKGQVNSVFHVDKQDWYVYIGRPSQRGYINVYDIATVTSYFMVGNKIEPIPDLPYQIAAAFGKPDNRNTTALASAKGYAFGAELNIATYKEFGFDFFTVYGGVDFIMGFDVMMQKYPASFICPNTGTNPGFKGWYLKGQLYAYLNANIGVKGEIKITGVGTDFDFKVFSCSAAAMLYGELMKPSYVEGHLVCHYNILNAVKGNFNYDFKKGTRCGG
jgi:hypothetical protein